MKPYVYIYDNLDHFFLEWEMFQTYLLKKKSKYVFYVL